MDRFSSYFSCLPMFDKFYQTYWVSLQIKIEPYEAKKK